MSAQIPELPAKQSTDWYAWAGAIDGASREHRVVKHGSTANTARPADAMSVTWIGSVQPTNMTADDLWIGPS